MDSKTGNQQLFPMYIAFTKVHVCFIGPYVVGYHIGLNLIQLLSQIMSDGTLTIIYKATYVLDGCNTTTYFYMNIDIVLLTEV